MNAAAEPKYLQLARDLIGLKEIHGPQHSAEILRMAQDARLGWVRDDETAWCSIFVCAMFERVGIKSTRSAAARSWSTWGVDVLNPYMPADIPLGSVVVYSRGSNVTQGHVGFPVGVNAAGHILTLGGNQADQVSISPFHPGRIVAVRFPLQENFDHSLIPRIPFMGGAGQALSTNEA